MKLAKIALLIALPVVTGAAALHDWPQDYDKARYVASVSLELEEGKTLSLSHNAMHWRQEIFDSILSGATKQFFDPHCWNRKFGKASIPSNIKLGDKMIPAGEYGLYQYVPGDDPGKFYLSFRKGADLEGAIDILLPLEELDAVEDHLILSLTPRGSEGLKFDLRMFYGNRRGTVSGQIVTQG